MEHMDAWVQKQEKQQLQQHVCGARGAGRAGGEGLAGASGGRAGQELGRGGERGRLPRWLRGPWIGYEVEALALELEHKLKNLAGDVRGGCVRLGDHGQLEIMYGPGEGGSDGVEFVQHDMEDAVAFLGTLLGLLRTDAGVVREHMQLRLLFAVEGAEAEEQGKGADKGKEGAGRGAGQQLVKGGKGAAQAGAGAGGKQQQGGRLSKKDIERIMLQA